MKNFKVPTRILFVSVIAIGVIGFVAQFMSGGRDYLENNPGMMELSQIEQQMDGFELSSIAPASGDVKTGDVEVNIRHLGLDFDKMSLPQPTLLKIKRPTGDNDRSANSILRGLEFYKYKKAKSDGSPRITIIIDDMGMGNSTSNIMRLPKGNLTLAYLPYAPNLSEQTKRAKKAGYELMVHMPMQPMDEKITLGPAFLTSDMDEESFQALLEKNLDTFDGYVGVNNHMGSKLTQDSRSMKMVMDALKKRGLLFVDSKTIQTSIAADTAKSFFVPYEVRDVFIDHDADIDVIRASLAKLERVAQKKGHAVAIGHPRPTTIQALSEWLPTLEKKGITLVDISEVVKKPKPLPTLITSHEKIKGTQYQ